MAYGFTKATFMAAIKTAVQAGLASIPDVTERDGVYDALIAALDKVADELALIDADI